MLEIDKKIMNIDGVICRHIGSAGFSPRGAVSQDILSQLRNFVEHIMLKIYANEHDIDNTYDNICRAISFVKSNGSYKVLNRFHEYLEIVASHYTLDEENSERLMLKYYTFLFKVRLMLRERFSLNVLNNLEAFPLHIDPALHEYYEKIASVLDKYSRVKYLSSDKYYIQKIKPFFVTDRIYYEVTFMPAIDTGNKTNRLIAFTSIDISSYYAVKFAFSFEHITIMGRVMPITIIINWEVSIRDCEYKNFSALIRGEHVSTGYAEQQAISRILSTTGNSLSDLLDIPEEAFNDIRNQVNKRSKSVVFFDDLVKCRQIVQLNMPGVNLIRYLLLHMNNRVMKDQYSSVANDKLYGLFFLNGCIPFDSMPFINSLLNHNPKLGDVFDCISTQGRQHELLARLVKNNTEMRGSLFTPIKNIDGFSDISFLVKEYNERLWPGHRQESQLVIENGQIFINRYKNDTCAIINMLREMAQSGVRNYSLSVESWLNSSGYTIDCPEKRNALIHMFSASKVALIYGSAGTGKSTLINHVAHFFSEQNKVFLAHTNPAVDNLKRRVSAANSTFSTIAKATRSSSFATSCDILIVDECSTVSNKDMRRLLNKINYKALLLVGDTYQISSIQFGNWFSVARSYVPATSTYELESPYRTKNNGLLTLWKRVRVMDDKIMEVIARQEYSTTLDASIFSSASADEIILCLNYDGLYGINNINRFLQESNPNPSVAWGIYQFKVGDPILFCDSDRFTPVIYNNMKGRITRVQIIDEGSSDERIQFDIELEKVINGMEAFGCDFILLDNGDSGNSVIRFSVGKTKSTDEDDNGNLSTVIPFQVAYAVSIHKAQGLEYRSVKIVITDEVDELITHNIFYTAITRAQERLKIYWTPEVENKVLMNMKPVDINRDTILLKKYLLQ